MDIFNSLFLPPRERGVLGMNARNALYIMPKNPRRLYPTLDNKLLSKEILEAHDIPIPPLYAKVECAFELAYLEKMLQWNEFVIKPARGAEGRGILVLSGRDGDNWAGPDNKRFVLDDIRHHMSNILAGLYSLGGTDDQAFIEYKVHTHDGLKVESPVGVPDIRILLYRGVPAMAMLRLPTRCSHGKANLHQGAVGLGVRFESGLTTITGVCKGKPIDRHPDTGHPFKEVAIPFWQQMIETAVRIYDYFPLGYMGVDFVVDQLLGPLILELNARPGLSIQLANSKGLLGRLRAIDRLGFRPEEASPQQRLEIVDKYRKS